MTQDSIGNIVRNAYSKYGGEVNRNRMFANISDGCKTVYKRAILGALEYPKDQFIKVATISGLISGKYHPHSTGSIDGVITRLVNMGIFDGKGNFGYSSMTQSFGAAASRYVHARLKPEIRNMIEPLMPYVRRSLGELDNLEHDYIPLPFPLSFVDGTTVMGVGTSGKYPNLDPKSLILATAKDDPKLLKSLSGLPLSDSEKIDFWNNSKGRFTYKFKYYKSVSGGLNGWYIEGNPSYVKPAIRILRQSASDGRLVIRDESTGSDFKLFIGIPKRIQVDHILIENQIKKACEIKTSYDLWAVYGTVTRPTTGKYWCNYCFNNYQRLCELYKKDKLEKLKIDLEAYINFKQIADLIINKPSMTYEQIKTQLKLTSISVVNKVGSMSVGSMRTTDGQQKAKSTQEKIDYFEKFTYKDLINPYLKSK